MCKISFGFPDRKVADKMANDHKDLKGRTFRKGKVYSPQDYN